MNQVWYVLDPSDAGYWPQLFDTKEAAEQYARELFPEESEEKRYSKIYYRNVYSKMENA